MPTYPACYAPISRTVCRWLVSVCLTVASPTASLRAPEPPSKAATSAQSRVYATSLALLTNAQQIRELTPDEANRGYPLRLRAVVTYLDPAQGDYFVQDATAGIYVSDATGALARRVSIGDLVEIDGVTEDIDFAPQIGKAAIRVLGRAPMPAHHEVGFDALISTREDSQWVEFEGVVRDVLRKGNSLALELSGGGGLVTAFILDPRGLDASRLIDAKVRAEGVGASDFNQKNQMLSAVIQLSDSRQLTLLEPPSADPFNIPVRSLGSLLGFTAAGATKHRTRVQGTFTLQRPKGLFIQDGAQGLYVPGHPLGPAVSPGDRVDVIGFADPGDYTPVMTHAVYQRIGSGTVPAPIRVSAQQALTGEFDTLRVTIDATLRGEGHSETDRTLILQEGDSLFEARLESSLAPANWPFTLPPGSRLRITGVCSVDVDRNRAPEGFNILLHGPGDIAVLSRPSWWTLRRILPLVLVLGGLMLSVAAWAAILRRRVRQQTEVIRRQMQTELELQKRFEYAARATQDTIWDWNLLTRQICWSEGIRKVLGYAPEHMCADADWWHRLIHPEDVSKVQHSLQATVAAGRDQWSSEYRVRRSDGSYAHVLDRGYVMYDASGAPWRVIGATMDITAQKRSEEQLAQERNLLRTLIDTVPDYIYVKDSQGKLLVVNRAFADLLGASSPEDLLGRTDLDLYPEDLARSFRHDDLKVLQSGEALINREETNVDAGGTTNWVLATRVPLRNRQNKTVGMMAVGRNITQRKQSEKEVEKARDAAQAASHAKDAFLANMSHEIRTPLNGILGMTELALDTGLDAEQREYLEAVKLSADSLLSVVNDILDFSKIEAGKLELSPVDFDLHAQLQEIIRLMSVPARLKGLTLGFEIGSGVPRLINGDPTRLRQVVVNLLGNGVKFTEHGRVAIEVFKESEDESSLKLHFIVWDTGIGIPHSKQRAIFEAFAQADGSTTRRFGGTGLGLTISSRLVEMMGGHIWVESEEWQGSRFHFTACFGAVRSTSEVSSRSLGTRESQARVALARLPQAALSPGGPILLAEDNAINRALVVRMLEKRAYRAVVAANGREAVEAFAKQPFALILMDVQMPGMDGIEATAAIRKMEEGSGARVPIVALTAYALKGDRERFLAAGMDAYLAKPVHSEDLLKTIDTLLHPGSNGNGSALWTFDTSGTPAETLTN